MSGVDAWSAKQYLQFEEERTRPARDLLAAVTIPGARHAVDLGCGPGNSTELLAKLSRGGCLAIQMPDNLDEPAQRAMREVAAGGPWRSKLKGVERARESVESAGWYYELLHPACSRVDVWRTTYHHALKGAAAIVDWFKGSGLLPFLAPLDGAERADYLARYTEAIEAAYPPLRDGTVLLPFPRLFVVAVR